MKSKLSRNCKGAVGRLSGMPSWFRLGFSVLLALWNVGACLAQESTAQIVERVRALNVRVVQLSKEAKYQEATAIAVQAVELAEKGLGTNHWSVEPALLYYQQVGERLSIESQIGDWHPTGGSAGVQACSCFSSFARSRPTTSGRVLSSCPSLMNVGPSSVSVRRMRASRVKRAIASPSRELSRSLMNSIFVGASQSARPYLLSTARISVQRLTLR